MQPWKADLSKSTLLIPEIPFHVKIVASSRTQGSACRDGILSAALRRGRCCCERQMCVRKGLIRTGAVLGRRGGLVSCPQGAVQHGCKVLKMRFHYSACQELSQALLREKCCKHRLNSVVNPSFKQKEPLSSGRSAAWLARLPWEQEVECSNHSAPTNNIRGLAFRS